MSKKAKLIIISFMALCCLFGVYFLFLSPQAQKTISVEGVVVNTLRHYNPTQYSLYMSKETIVADNSRESASDNSSKTEEYEALHLHYPSFLVSIEDFKSYVRFLQSEGFLVITAVNPSLLEGKGCFYELAKPLTGEGYTILVTVNYNYARKLPTISYMKLPGEAEKMEIEKSQDE